ncbi:hypothetical protein [Maricaulis sp.]|uniref:hypothetical protein n=1 Tax=Maricaulis sp. TaxID=1486257 RepID=UPI001B0E914F|nr:hypothetical protein [Maricaulis sp.]MBO6797580.1 hypothetical protein [Maricaulis sp.]
MSIQDINNQIADRFEPLDRKYWVIGLCLLVGLNWAGAQLWYGLTLLAQSRSISVDVVALFAGLRRLVDHQAFEPLLILFLQGIASFWLTEAGPTIRRGLVVSAAAILLVILTRWLGDVALYSGTGFSGHAYLLCDLLALFAVCWPTVLKFRVLSRMKAVRPSLAAWWEICFIAILVLPGLIQAVKNLTAILLSEQGFSVVHGGESHAVLGTAVMVSWYFWFDRMWRVRFNRVLVTLHLGAALVGPLTLAFFGMGRDVTSIWRYMQGDDLRAQPTSQLDLDYSALQAMNEHVALFQMIAIALFGVVLLEAMVRKMMGGTVQTYDAATARRLRRYAALVLLAGLLFMGENFLVYFVLSL